MPISFLEQARDFAYSFLFGEKVVDEKGRQILKKGRVLTIIESQRKGLPYLVEYAHVLPSNLGGAYIWCSTIIGIQLPRYKAPQTNLFITDSIFYSFLRSLSFENVPERFYFLPKAKYQAPFFVEESISQAHRTTRSILDGYSDHFDGFKKALNDINRENPTNQEEQNRLVDKFIQNYGLTFLLPQTINNTTDELTQIQQN